MSVDVAGPGFVNLSLEPGWLHDTLVEVVDEGESSFAAPDLGHGERVQVEFISANPTGPLHVGNGWWGSYGERSPGSWPGRVGGRARVLRQRHRWADPHGSARACSPGVAAKPSPKTDTRVSTSSISPSNTRGPTIPTTRRRSKRRGDSLRRGSSSRYVRRSRPSGSSTTAGTARPRSRRRERSADDRAPAGERPRLRAGRRDLAQVERARRTRDRVLVKSNGDVTYLAGDLAYHRDKFLVRGFDRVIDVFGADHHGQVASLRAGVRAMGIDPDRLEVKLGQMVSI